MQGQQSPNEGFFLVPWHFESCISAETGTYLAGYHGAASPKDLSKHKPRPARPPRTQLRVPRAHRGAWWAPAANRQPRAFAGTKFAKSSAARGAKTQTGSRGIILLYFGGMDLFRQSTKGAARKDATGKDRRVPGPRSRTNPRPVTSCPVKCNYCNLPQPLKIQIPA